jgi:hypothetical protein
MIPDASVGRDASAGTGGVPGKGGAPGTGGAPGKGGAPGTGGTTASTGAFDWGSTTYSSSGGSGTGYQGHYTGQTCVDTTCHRHNITFGGTIYQSNGSSTAGNIQIGILMGGKLTTAYSGSQGNFYGNISGTSWSTAQIAIRNSTGTQVMPTNDKATGNCNNCHGSSNRIVAP